MGFVRKKIFELQGRRFLSCVWTQQKDGASEVRTEFRTEIRMRGGF